MGFSPVRPEIAWESISLFSLKMINLLFLFQREFGSSSFPFLYINLGHYVKSDFKVSEEQLKEE